MLLPIIKVVLWESGAACYAPLTQCRSSGEWRAQASQARARSPGRRCWFTSILRSKLRPHHGGGAFGPGGPRRELLPRISNELAPFELPVGSLHSEPGQLPWRSLDEAGHRLLRFAHRFGSYDWSNDPRQDEQLKLLQSLGSGKSDDPRYGHDEYLWHCPFAVVRADRFNDGLVAANVLA